jgi:hypothetical protein
MQAELRIVLMRIDIKVVDARRVERRRPPLHAMHIVGLGEQELGQIRAILARGARNERGLPRHFPLPLAFVAPDYCRIVAILARNQR